MGREKLRLQLARCEERMWNDTSVMCVWCGTLWVVDQGQSRRNSACRDEMVRSSLSNAASFDQYPMILSHLLLLGRQHADKMLILPQHWSLQAVSRQGFPEFGHIAAWGVPTVCLVHTAWLEISLFCFSQKGNLATPPAYCTVLQPGSWEEGQRRHNHGAWKIFHCH